VERTLSIRVTTYDRLITRARAGTTRAQSAPPRTRARAGTAERQARHVRRRTKDQFFKHRLSFPSRAARARARCNRCTATVGPREALRSLITRAFVIHDVSDTERRTDAMPRFTVVAFFAARKRARNPEGGDTFVPRNRTRCTSRVSTFRNPNPRCPRAIEPRGIERLRNGNRYSG